MTVQEYTPSPSGVGWADQAGEAGVVLQEVSKPNSQTHVLKMSQQADSCSTPFPIVSPVIPDFTCLGCDASHN